ncbi:unnamed protein product [Prorocentrum cordatum]|uniref:Uncharacterized protein n=1 Tax=Prorocentrum cordatum TaxID=2364126 RepID=A0ABN9R2H1_9DINO|nr:unnamed protein product [Polarella glacialis]
MLQDHSETHGKHSQDLDERRAAHASLEERVAYLEKELGDSGLDERRTAHASLEERLVEFQGRVADVEGSLREDLKDLQDLRAFYRRHSSLPERVTWLEQEHASAAERRVAETVSLRRLHEEIRGMHDGTCLEARVGALERKEAQSVRQLDLLADCLQRELRAKSSQLRRPSSPASLALPAGGDSPEGTVPSRPSPAAPPSEPSARGIWWG